MSLLQWGWKAVNVDLTTRYGFQYPFPGTWIRSDENVSKENLGNPCPRSLGDGLCIAKTFAGAASSGIALNAIIFVGYRECDILGEDPDKIRVRKLFVHSLHDGQKLIKRFGNGADLSGADLSGADLRSAYLCSANLHGADLHDTIGYEKA